MTTKPESRLHRQIKRELKLQFPGSWWMKVHGGPFQIAGVPDLIGCVCGKFIALEVKMPDGGKPTEIQKAQISRIKKAGGHAQSVRSSREAVRAVQTALGLSD